MELGWDINRMMRPKQERMTYKRFQWQPSNRLNVILGPNGSGKSSLICAICFVLGGNPAVIGRANKFSEFISYGNTQSVIEIELYNSQGSNWKIKRELFSSNRNNFFLNGTSSSLKEVEKLVHSLNIQVNNLCQFLPQEKVCEFVRMSPQELLASTEKCVGGADLATLHETLNAAGQLKLGYEKKIDELKTRLSNAIDENMLLQHDVENFRQREIMLESVKLLKQKKMLVLYMSLVDEYKSAFLLKESIEKNLKFSRKCLQPLEVEEAALNKRLKQLEIANRGNSEDFASCIHKLNAMDNDISVLKNKCDDLTDTYNQNCEEEKLRLDKMQALKKQIELVLSEYRTYDLKLPHEKLDQFDAKMKEINDRLFDVNVKISEVSERERLYTSKVKELSQKIHEIESVENERLSMLQRRNRDAYAATMWLRKNLNKFKKPCYEPPLLCLDICNQSYAKFIEFIIPHRDFLAMFLFESSDDLELFLSEVHDKLQLNVNAGLVPSVPVYSFKPRKPIEDYRHYGFETYLREAVRAPDSVMSYLCQYFALHRIPVGNAYTKTRVAAIATESPELNRFFTTDFCYTLSKSRYSGRISSFSSFVPPASFLTNSRDLIMLRKLTDQKKEMLSRVEEEKLKMNVLLTEKDELVNVLNAVKAQKKETMDYLKKAESCGQKLLRTQEMLKNCENYKVNLQELEQITRNKRSELLFEIMKKVLCQQEVVNKLINCQLEKTRTYSRLKNEKIKLAEKKSQYENELKQAEMYSMQLKEAIEKCALIKAKCLEQINEARNYHSNCGFKFRFDDLFTKIASKYGLGAVSYDKKSLEDLRKLPSTLEEIDAAVYEFQAKADCRYAVDDNVILLYEQREAAIRKLKAELGQTERQLEEHVSSIEDKKYEWLKSVKNLVSRIDIKFGILFHELNCDGQVLLAVPPDENDYANYGISIMVKFREKENLHQLSGSMQSGGERSVSTMLYMIALQDLSQCPFRCVDEINQGMDTHNERKVFDLIVKHTSVKGSQYFLISPKLLKGLNFGRNVNVCVIYKGLCSTEESNLQLKSHLKSYRAQAKQQTNDLKSSRVRKSSYNSTSDSSESDELRIVEDSS